MRCYTMFNSRNTHTGLTWRVRERTSSPKNNSHMDADQPNGALEFFRHLIGHHFTKGVPWSATKFDLYV